ncbi:MAG: hypothetical protein Q8R30_05240 [bacterium]|nr:hypothetical protein [bacterium]MDZ4285523.1 hypothetical protein [Candidatus Sungbacteria bacterium]
MTPYNPEEVEQHFQQLPEALKEQMLSADNSERIFQVGKKFGLTVEQIGFLAEESGYVVLGLTHPNDFVTRLSEHLRIDLEQTKTIAREINHQIFFPLREMLKSAHQFEITQEKIQQSQPTPPLARTQTPAPPPIKPTPPPVSIRPHVPPPIDLRQSVPPAPHMPATVPLRPIVIAPIAPKPIPPLPLAPLPPATPPAAPMQRPVPPTITPLTPSSIQEKKIDTQTQTPPKPIVSPPPPQTPLAPSQIMQKKIIQEAGQKEPEIKPETERIKESVFGAPSAPAAPAELPQQPASQPMMPLPPAEENKQPTQVQVPRSNDPYREPIE